ncbi:hypothetical protein ABVT39_002862 [Epinephelus coioides]
MSAFSSTATAADSVMVVTHVHRTIQPVLPRHSRAPGQRLNPGNSYSLSGGQAQVVGLVQNVIGIIIVVFGSIMAANNEDKLSVDSGVFVWGPLLFIIAGSVTVSAGMSMSQYRMKCAVGYNVVAAVVSFPVGIIFFLDTTEILKTNDNDYPPWFPDHDEGRFRWFTGVSAFLSFCEFCLSMCVAGNSCRRQHHSTAPPLTITNHFTGTTSVTAETPHVPMDPPPPYEPPEYSSIVNRGLLPSE